MLAELRNEFASLDTVAIIGTDYQVKGYHLDVEVGAAQVVAAAELLDRLGFFLESITGVDWLGKTPVGNQIEVAAEPAADGEAAADSEADTSEADAEVVADQLEVVYDYNRTDGELCRVVVRCRLERANPE
ncbi:MAG: hypothetical protein KAS94_09795, partial [Desulfobulbaceae bacterium]|nr:hypothetical protein [Desulfobulbaceae bacterium]